MRLLDIVNRARRECGVSGNALLSVTGALTMEGQRFVDWATDAWNDLQLEKNDWQWMRKGASFQTVAGQPLYTLAQANATDLAMWKRDSFRCYLTATGMPDEMILAPFEYDTWRNVFQFGTARVTTGRPIAFAVQPLDHSLAIGPLPDNVYTVVGEYYRQPTALALDADDPASPGNDFPTRYHMLLVYMIMDAYASYESAPEVAARAAKGKLRMKSMIMRDFLPQIGFGAPLA